jgi:hypothetical protein
MRRPAANGCRPQRRVLPAALCGVLLAIVFSFAFVGRASAITVVVADPASLVVNATTSYSTTGTISRTNEKLTSVTYTFPLNTLVDGVTLASISVRVGATPYAVSQLAVDSAARTVHFHVDGFPASAIGVAAVVSLGDIMNPSRPGSYSSGNRPRVDMATMVGATNYTATGYKIVAFVAADTTGLTVGTPILTNYQTNVAAGYTIPFTVGPLGRIASNAALGANTIVITFPSGTTVPNPPLAGSVMVNGVVVTTCTGSNSTKKVTITVPNGVTVPNGGAVTVVMASNSGLISTSALPSPKTLGVNTSAQTAPIIQSGNYTIVSAPTLSMSVDSPTIDFGPVEPGAAPSERHVVITVDSSAPYTLSRTLGGSHAAMGLSVAGDANGSKLAGHGDFTDSLTVALPWTTVAGTPLSATVTYTAVQ